MKDEDNKQDTISDIYTLLKNKANPEYYSLNVIFSVIGSLCVIGIFFSDPNEVDNYNYTLYLIGMVILYILVVFNSIKIVEPVEQFINIPITKFIILSFVSGVFAYSTVQASIELNSIFEISSSSFKTALLFGSFLIFLEHLIYLLHYYIAFIVIVFMLNYLFDSYIPNKKDKNKDKSTEEIFDVNNLELNSDENKDKSYKEIFNGKNWEFKGDKNAYKLIVMVLFFLGIIHLGNIALNQKSLKYKLFVLATNYDFDSKHSCKNIISDYPVAYVGANMDKVIINMNSGKYDVKINGIESFLRDKNYESFNQDLVEVKGYFKYERCIF